MQHPGEATPTTALLPQPIHCGGAGSIGERQGYMTHGTLYSCPRSLTESWWIPLEEAGLEVELTPPLAVSTPPERDGVTYRKGVVRHGDAWVEISACPGPYSPSSSPLRGQHLLHIGFRKAVEKNASLAQLAAQLLCAAGASEILKPERTQE